jgi:hypothetical protein
MTALEISRRLDARKSGKGFIARCPAHNDRRPSLSISEGRDGRTLLRCFAGCEPEAIASALGLTMGDLFAATSRPAHPQRATIEMAQAALDDELRAVLDREERRLGFRPPTLTRHKNEARSVVEQRFGVSFSRHASPWWEVEPHCTDPEWRALIERGTEEFAWEIGIDAAELTKALPGSLPFQGDVLRRARRLQQELTKGVAPCVPAST